MNMRRRTVVRATGIAGIAAACHIHHGLAPAGPRRALPPALLLAGGLALTSFAHGSFFPIGRAYQDLEVLDGDPEVRQRLLATAKVFEQATVSAYIPLGATTAAASVLILDTIRRGETAYPRWSAPVIAPLIPITAATALTATRILPGRVGYALHGAGVNLGSLVSLTASTLLLWRNRKAGTA